MPTVHPFFAKKRVKLESDVEGFRVAKNLQKCGKEPAPWPQSFQLLIEPRTPSVICEPVPLPQSQVTLSVDYFSLSDKRKLKPNPPSLNLPTPLRTVPTQKVLMKIAQKLNDSEDNLIVFLHGPAGSGKTHFAEQVLPAALGRRLFLLDASQPRTSKSFDPLLQHLLHSHPHSSMLLVDALECLFSATERSFPAALSTFLAEQVLGKKGFLMVLTSEWDQEQLMACLGIKLPFSVESIKMDFIGLSVDTVRMDIVDTLDSVNTVNTVNTVNSASTTLYSGSTTWDTLNTLDTLDTMTLDTFVINSLPIAFSPFEDQQPLDELLWSNQIPDHFDHFVHSASNPLQRRVQKRFFEYGRSLNRPSLWKECLLTHVLNLEHLHSLQPESQRRGRRIPYYKYIVDDGLLRQLIKEY